MDSNNGIELETIASSRIVGASDDSYDNLGFTSNLTSSTFHDDTSNNSKEKIYCSKHPTYTIMFFCHNCVDPVCTQCMTKHTDHHVSSFTAATATIFGNLSNHVEELNHLNKALKESRQTTLERRKIMEKSMTEARKVIDHQFALMHAKLDAAYSKMTENIDSASSTYLYKCDKLLESISIMKETLDPYDSFLFNLDKNSKSEMQIFSLENSAKKELEFVKSRMSELVAPDLEIVKLKWNPSISETFSENSSIGSVHVEVNFLECQQICEFSVKHMNDKNTAHIDSIAALENGNIVVVDSNNAKLKVFNNTGKILFCFVGAGKYHVPSPRRVVGLPNNKLVVSDYTSKIVLFNTNGTGSSIFNTDSISNGMCYYGSKICTDNFTFDNAETLMHEKVDVRSSLHLNSENETLVDNDFSQHSNVFLKNKKSISSKSSFPRSDSQSTLRSLDSDSDDATQYELLMGNSAMKCMEILQISGKHFRKAHEDIQLKTPSKQHIRALNITVSPLNNNIYFIDELTKSLLVFDENGNYLSTYNRCSNPVSVLCDRQGNVLVLDSFKDSIHLLDAECNFIQYVKIQNKKVKSLSNIFLAEIKSPTTFTLNDQANSLIIGHNQGFIKVCSYGVLSNKV